MFETASLTEIFCFWRLAGSTRRRPAGWHAAGRVGPVSALLTMPN